MGERVVVKLKTRPRKPNQNQNQEADGEQANMKWIKLLIDIALAIIPGLALKGKKNLEQELEIANKTIELLTKETSPEEKGKILERAITSLGAYKNFSKRVTKKLDKAKNRLYKKLFK